MWNKHLVACARAYPSAVLTLIESEGYPASARCDVQFDEAREVIAIPTPPPLAAEWRGKACLLFHRHTEKLEAQYEMLIKGTLTEEDGVLILQPSEFVTGSGSPKTDRMPHAGSPVELVQFMLLGRRKAREYLAKRAEPWPPRPWDKMLRYLDEHPG